MLGQTLRPMVMVGARSAMVPVPAGVSAIIAEAIMFTWRGGSAENNSENKTS